MKPIDRNYASKPVATQLESVDTLQLTVHFVANQPAHADTGGTELSAETCSNIPKTWHCSLLSTRPVPVVYPRSAVENVNSVPVAETQRGNDGLWNSDPQWLVGSCGSRAPLWSRE